MPTAEKRIKVSESDKKFYEENGYLIVRNVLTEEQVAFLRKRFLGIWETDEWKVCESNTERNLVDIYKYFPEVMRLTLTKDVVDIAKYLIRAR